MSEFQDVQVEEINKQIMVVGFEEISGKDEIIWDDADPYQDLQTLYDAGLSVVPLDKDCQLDKEIRNSLFSVRLGAEVIMRAARRTSNFGILTGRTSNNLFAICCKDEQSYLKMKNANRDLVRWVTNTNEGYMIWLTCTNGEVASSKFAGNHNIIGKGRILLVPPSIESEGAFVQWIERNGNEPPSIDRKTLEDIIDGVYIYGSRKVVEAQLKARFFEDINELGFIDQQKLNALTYDWGKGNTGATRREVYFALLKRAKLEKHNNFRATTRELAEISGVSKKTVVKHLRYFLDRGIINLVIKDRNGYHFSLCALKKYTTNGIKTNGVLYPELADHDIWSYFGLGKTGKRIYSILIDKSIIGVLATVKQLANVTNITEKTTLSKLRKMETLGLVLNDQDQWYTISELFINLEEKAKKLKVYGSSDRRHQAFQKDREIHAEKLLERKQSL